MAAVVREALSEYLKRPVPGNAWQTDPIGSITGIADGHPSDSEQIDDVLYGDQS